MKLKQAKKIARKRGFGWIAVDASDHILAFKKEPKIHTYCEEYSLIDWSGDGITIGSYSGLKWWTNTKREV